MRTFDNWLSEEIVLHLLFSRRRSEWTESDSAYSQQCLCSGTLESMLAKWLRILGAAQERAAPYFFIFTFDLLN